jgi:hypothetical protein
MQNPEWITALGTVAGVVIAWIVARGAGRKEAERYSQEQSREKEQFKIELAVWRSKIEFMVGELWASQGRRGTTAAVIKGLGEVHSPLKATVKGREIFAAITPDIDAFYRTEGHTLDEGMLRAKLESLFGDRIMREICIPHHFMQSECIEIAVAIVREDWEKEHAQ